jgi:hypothetical protein
MGYEEKVRETIEGNAKLTRQQRRQLERSGRKFEVKKTFSKVEVEQANAAAYEYGKQLVLKAATQVLGLGPKRIERIETVLTKLEYETFIKPFENDKTK